MWGDIVMRIQWYLFVILLFSSAIRCMEVPIPEEDQDTIKIRTSDEKEFEVPVDVAIISVTIRHMLEDISVQLDVPIPLNILSKWFGLAQGAMTILHDHEDEQEEDKLSRLENYVQPKNLDAKQLAIFGAAANYLDIGLLLEVIVDTLLSGLDTSDKLRNFITWTRSEEGQEKLGSFLDSAKNIIRDALILVLTGIYTTRERNKITIHFTQASGLPMLVVAISPDGNMLVGAHAHAFDVWDVISKEHLYTFSLGVGVMNSVSFNAESKILALSMLDDDFAIRLFNVDRQGNEFGNEIKRLEGHVDTVFSVAFSPQKSTTLASGSRDGTIILWDVENPENKIILCTPVARALEGGRIKIHGQEIESIGFSPDGSILAAGLQNGIIKLWDVETYELIDTLSGHTDSINSVVFSPDGHILASASKDTTIRLWNMETRKNIKKLTGHKRSVRSVAFSKDGRVLVSGSFDETIRLWNVKTGKSIGRFVQSKDSVYSVVFSPDGKMFASGSTYYIRLWEFLTDNDVEILDQIEEFKFEGKDFTFEKMLTLYFFAQHRILQPLWMIQRAYYYILDIQPVHLGNIYQSIDQEARALFEKALSLK